MSKVTVELSEYNNLRDRAIKYDSCEKEFKEKIEKLKAEHVKQIEKLATQGKVAVMVKTVGFLDWMGKPTIESIANLDDVKDEVKAFFEKEEKAKVIEQEFEKLKKSVAEPLEKLTEENSKLKATIENIKSLPWWKRLFNKF